MRAFFARAGPPLASLCAAVAGCNAMDIIHGDVKVENLMVRPFSTLPAGVPALLRGANADDVLSDDSESDLDDASDDTLVPTPAMAR